jgi:hypothetical protein
MPPVLRFSRPRPLKASLSSHISVEQLDALYHDFKLHSPQSDRDRLAVVFRANIAARSTRRVKRG